MATVTEIKEKLRKTREWENWMDELEQDARKSVRTLLSGWKRQYAARQAIMQAHQEKLTFDLMHLPGEGGTAAGVDEAGRGPLAGPVVTAAVILPEKCEQLAGLTDSKQLNRAKREQFAAMVKELAVSYQIHIQPAEEIDRLNIYEATRQSMTAAVTALSVKPSVVLADAMMLPVAMPCISVIKGDAKSLAIAAASVLAKTERDRIMCEYAAEYPAYGFDQHAGYGTKEHLTALNTFGATPLHRKTFEPVKSLIAEAKVHGHFD